MKSRILVFAVFIVAVLAYAVFLLNESAIIAKLTPYFPVNEENSVGYYADLVSFLASEAFWIVALVAITLYFTGSGKFSESIQSIETAMLSGKRATLYVSLLVFVVLTCVVATVALQQFPNSADEFAYLFQAEQLSEGKLWDPVHPVPDFFEFHHLAQKDGKWVGRFPPGWPLLLSIAFLLHIPPFLINTILATVAAFVFFRLMSHLYDERIAIWSTLTLLFSGFFIFNAATFFSHIASLLEGLLFVYFAYRYLQTKQNACAFAAGVFLGMLAMTRQLTAVIFALPFVIYFFYQLKTRAIVPLLIMAAGSLPFIAFFLWYNYQVTGDALVPVTMWTNSDEALGFVKGHTPVKGAKFTFKRLAMFVYWASPALLILYVVFLFLRLRDWKKLLAHPEDYLFLLLMVGYFFYYHSGGNQYGPRFYLEGFPFLAGFVVARTLRSPYRWAKVFLFCAIAYNIVRLPFISAREREVIVERKDVYNQVESQGIRNAVVFIASGTGIIRPMPVEDLNRNKRDYSNDVIYARDLGEHNVALMRHYEGKDFYIYRRAEDSVSGELIKISPEHTP